jgi:tetratricopeptide (TPR) repeat protein
LYWLLICVATTPVYGSSLPSDMHSMALSTIDYIYNEQYDEAKNEARKIIKRYPAHPAGYFFMAVAIDSWMTTHFSDKQENEFYRYCELAIEKGEKALEKKPDDEWVKFYMGGAEGYKGTYEARYERWITAFRYGWKGVSILMQLKNKNSTIVDIGYGIGSYEYWRSALMKSLWWMPGVEDKRQEGIEKILYVVETGIYTKAAALVSLMDIYLNEKKNEEALSVADHALAKYPKSLVFIFGKGNALFKLKNYSKSEATFREALSFLDSAPDDNRAAKAFCHFWIAKNALFLEHFNECTTECDQMRTYDLTEDNKKNMQKYFTEIESIKKQAISGRKNR